MKKHSVDIHFALLILVIILMHMFVGCSISRKMNKEQSSTSESGKVTNDTKITNNDKSITRITESIDTTAKTPGVDIKGEGLGKYLQTVINGDTLTAEYDPETNKITAGYKGKPKAIPIKSNKTTEIFNNKQQTVVQKTDSSYKKKEDTLSKQVEQKSKPSFVFWCLGGAALLVIIFFIYKSGILQKIFILIKPTK